MDRKCIVIAGSAGSLGPIESILKSLTYPFPIPIIIMVHMKENSYSFLPEIIRKITKSDVVIPENFEHIGPGRIYIAPPIYHLQVETDFTFSFAVDERVNFSRPSIDVLLETVAYTYKKMLQLLFFLVLQKMELVGAKL